MGHDDEDEDHLITAADMQRAELHKRKANETAKALAPFIENNKLNPELLKHVLDKHAPGNDAVDDGVYANTWLATDTFYRFTEDYVKLEERLAFKMHLERVFPGKKQ
jgi:hypothetical protein